MRAVVSLVSLLAIVAACGDDGTTMPDAELSLVPADYSSYTEVRDCRSSGDHLLMKIRILADPTILDAYQNRNAPFPAGGILLKEERDSADTTCSGPIESWAIAVKLPDGSSPSTLDFQWQRVRVSDNKVVTEDVTRCINCHANCVAPDFYGYTCADP
jgi:hypothetical protein